MIEVVYICGVCLARTTNSYCNHSICYQLFEPAHTILVQIPLTSSKGPDEPAHMHYVQTHLSLRSSHTHSTEVKEGSDLRQKTIDY